MTVEPKCIGVLSLGQRSTDFYLQQLRSKNLQLSLVETGFESDINPYLPSNFHILDGRLRDGLNRFEAVDAIVIPNITLHETLDRIDPDGALYSVVHAVNVSVTALEQASVDEVTLIGSLYTMQGDYLKEKFASAGIKINVPDEAEQEIIDGIRRKIYAGLEDPVNLQSYQAALEK